MLNEKVFQEGISILTTSFKNIVLEKPQIKVIKLLLSDLTDDEFTGAVLRFCRNRKEIYPGSNISALIREEVSNFSSKELTAEEAWGIVQKDISNDGIYGFTVKYKNYPAIKNTVETIGWGNICHGEESNSALRAHFFRTYDAYKNRADNDKINDHVKSLAITFGNKLDMNKAITQKDKLSTN